MSFSLSCCNKSAQSNQIVFFSHILYGEDEYKLHFHIQPLSRALPLVILPHFLPILPPILLKKATNQSFFLKKAIDKPFSFQWILVSFKVLLTWIPTIYLEQFIGPTNSSRQACNIHREVCFSAFDVIPCDRN